MTQASRALALVALLTLAGCAEPLVRESGPVGPVDGPVAGTDAVAPPATAVTVDEFDTTSAAERAEAAAAPSAGTTEEVLGTTVASLGDPAEPGFWAETPLVTAVRPGRLTYGATGQSVLVELRPSGGAAGSGTRVSLPAMRVLDAPLTALPELTVVGL